MKKFEITHAYTVLHFDDYPILFIGINSQNQTVIGSFIYEDEEENLLFFYLIVSNEISMNFLNQKVSYLDVMTQASDIYIVTKDFNDNVISTQEVQFQDIDPSILPLPSAYCPTQDRKVFNMYEINSMLAHAHKFHTKNLARRKEKPRFGYLEDIGRLWYSSSRLRSSYSVSIENNKQAHEYKTSQTQSSYSFKTNTKELHSHV